MQAKAHPPALNRSLARAMLRWIQARPVEQGLTAPAGLADALATYVFEAPTQLHADHSTGPLTRLCMP